MKPELKQQIENEAEYRASLQFHKKYSSDQWQACVITFRQGATEYADKWQAAEERAETIIEKIIDLMDFVAEAKGHISDEEIISQVQKSLPELLEALTPKTSDDE